jgi:hypothetical protein
MQENNSTSLAHHLRYCCLVPALASTPAVRYNTMQSCKIHLAAAAAAEAGKGWDYLLVAF